MRKNIIKTLSILSVLYFTVGCKKITDINTSPNNPPLSAATPEVLFPSGVASTAARVGGELNILGGFWSQYYTQSTIANQYRNIDSYNLTRNDMNGDYNELFAGALEDYQLAITQAKANGQWNYFLMATVMKAYTYEVLVDLWDQVPYTQAFQGQANIQPVFDKGHDIYDGLIKEIDNALAQNYNVQLSAQDAPTDFVFGGGKGAMTKWAEFAHTLELKMYLRMVNAYPSEAQAGIAKLYASPDFLSVDAGMTNFVNTPNKDNPFYEYNIRSLNTTTNIRASSTFVSFLLLTRDPRVQSYFGAATPTSINQGDYLNTNTALGSAATPVQKPTDPVWFISAAESHFLQAEALHRLNNDAQAKTQYMAGVEASFVDNGFLATDADNFVNNSTNDKVNWDISTNKLRTIIYQKWVSFAQGCHTLEGFFDQERTGYPETTTIYSGDPNYTDDQTNAAHPTHENHAGQWVYSKNGVTPNKQFPKRLIFPASEGDRNKNTPAQVPITTPVWWGLTAQ